MECTDREGFSDTARRLAADPRNYGPLDDFNGRARITGPCGDTMEFWLSAANGIVARMTFTTDGCGPSRACGSMATSLVEGRRIEDAAALAQGEILEALGGIPPEFEHCALLAANTVKAACEDYRRRSARGAAEPGAARASCAGCARTDCPASGRGEGESDEEFEDRRQLAARLCRIRRKVIVLSGKGGVGKSTVAVNLAAALVLAGKKVGLLDVDIHGPSIPTMLGLEREKILNSEEGIVPVDLGLLKVMSLGFLLPSADDAVIWRGPMKMAVIKQFLKDVAWGDLDYLVVDSPPGTGDEPLSVCQLIGPVDGALIVTTPQKVAAVDVRKSVTFCRRLDVPILGIVENMSGFTCPRCGETTPILRAGGGRRTAEDMGVPFLGSIPMDPQIAEACDDGRTFVARYAASATAKIMRSILDPIAAQHDAEDRTAAARARNDKEDK